MASTSRSCSSLSTGVPGFDELVEGGLPPRRLYVLCGPPGSGKTTFSARLIAEGVRQGERGLFLTMHETREELITDMGAFTFGFERAARSDNVKFLNLFDDDTRSLLNAPTIEQANASISAFANRLVAYIESLDIDRVVLDSTMLIDYLLRKDDTDIIPFLTTLKQAPATVFLISEMTDPGAYEPEHFLAHGVIYFHNYLNDSQMQRGVQVLKLRGGKTDAEIYPLSFSNEGVEISPTPLAQ